MVNFPFIKATSISGVKPRSAIRSKACFVMFIINIQYVCTVCQYTFGFQGEIELPQSINTQHSEKMGILAPF